MCGVEIENAKEEGDEERGNKSEIIGSMGDKNHDGITKSEISDTRLEQKVIDETIPTTLKESNGPRASGTVFINGFSARTLFDSGATTTIMGRAFFQHVVFNNTMIKIKYDRAAKIKLRFGDDRMATEFGRAELQLKIGEKSFTHNVAICTQLAYDLILGTDFMKRREVEGEIIHKKREATLHR